MARERSTLRMLAEGLEGTLLLVLTVVTWPVSRWFLNNLGSRPGDRTRDWPGDALLPSVDSSATRAVTVRVSSEAVWPWLVQFGLGRAGFYSYELLERLGGIKVRNLECIESRFQTLELDQEIRLHPSASVWVGLVQPNEHICFRTWRDKQDIQERNPHVAASWSLYLVASSPDACRLVLRACKHGRRRRGLGRRLAAFFLEDPLDLVMEQRMLRTIRRLAESR